MTRWLWLLVATVLGGCAASGGPALETAAGPTPAPLEDERSVAPGINETWKTDRIGPLIARMEGESREIWQNRAALADIVNPPAGSTVADVGAGTGFMTLLFAERVGADGRVVAVDINETLMELVAERATEAGLDNVHTVVCGERSVDLPPRSVDLVFICDTYHHFEYPRNTMASIHAALRPGGEVVVVDFHRIPGVSRPFILEHVRAGQEVFTEEILDAGFELVTEHEATFLEENYMLRFRRR